MSGLAASMAIGTTEEPAQEHQQDSDFYLSAGSDSDSSANLKGSQGDQQAQAAEAAADDSKEDGSRVARMPETPMQSREYGSETEAVVERRSLSKENSPQGGNAAAVDKGAEKLSTVPMQSVQTQVRTSCSWRGRSPLMLTLYTCSVCR